MNLDPVTSEAFRPPPGPETFQQQRLRLDRQETLSFGPQRPRHQEQPSPYQKPPSEAVEMAFEVQDLDQSRLPSGWVFNKDTHNLELKHKLADFWEVKGGCLIRHHIRPRSKKFIPSDQADLPVPVEHLDNIRVTIFREPGQDPSSTTDHFKTENVFRQHSKEAPKKLPSKWTGCTIFQIKAETRHELGMTATMSTSSPTSVRLIRKAAQQVKTQQLRHIKKEKSEIRKKNLAQAEQQLFYEAKCKELRSFFECGVWEFATSDKADTQRTLSSRMLLKWAKNPDGSPRAKARLVVHGYNDADALAGNLDTHVAYSIPIGQKPSSLHLSDASLAWLVGRCRDGISTRNAPDETALAQVAQRLLADPWMRPRNSYGSHQARLRATGCTTPLVAGSHATPHSRRDGFHVILIHAFLYFITTRMTTPPNHVDSSPCTLTTCLVQVTEGCPTDIAAERRLKEVFDFRSLAGRRRDHGILWSSTPTGELRMDAFSESTSSTMSSP